MSKLNKDWETILEPYAKEWNKVRGLDLYHHKTKELAIVETVEGNWIVLADKANPRVEASYDSFDDAWIEWSHA
jgi:hypothetical protein